MLYKIIQGTFHVAGYYSGGDSIRFTAVDDENWNFFDWKKDYVKRRHLRLEAIDTLEIYYKGLHQPYPAATAALETLLGLVGIHDVIFSLSRMRICSAQDGTEGFIASRALDVYNRPVSLVFTNDVRLADGDEIPLADLPLEQCVNVKLAKMGLAYPTFYSTMEDDLLNLFTEIVTASRKNRMGLWKLDRTSEFTLQDTATVTDNLIILPKLFRRLTMFFHARGDLAHLASYLSHLEDKVTIRSTGQQAYLGDLFVTEGKSIRLPYKPEDLIFEPSPPVKSAASRATSHEQK